MLVPGLLVFFGCLALTYPAFGQLGLVSSTPADGDTDVDTLLTLVLEFSAPLDTTARFDEPDGFYLGLEVFPTDSVGDPGGGITISADSTTVTAEGIPLTPNTKFVFLLRGARSAAGEPLDRPYGFTFTTGSSLPEGSVSGTVSYPGGDPGGTAVGLFYEPPFGIDDEDGGGPDLEAGAVIPLSADTFIVNYVPAGSYYVLGFKDANQDGEFEFPGDAFGGYDADGDSLADRLTIGEGQNLAGIDFTIGISPDATARETFLGALNAAQAHFPDAQLSVMVTSPVSTEGTSQNWLYGFYSAAEESLFGVGRVGESYFFFTFPMDGDDGPTTVPEMPLPEDWIDSDMAADTAEAYVGSGFRSTHEDAQANAFAATFIFSDSASVTGGQPGWRLGRSLAQDAHGDSRQTTASQDTISAWIFFYYSEATGEETGILLDVQTGSPIDGPWPGAPSSARENLDAANQAGMNWAGDAVLVSIGNAPNLTPEGYAQVWGFAYYSAAKDSILSVFMISGMAVAEETDSADVVPSLQPLPPEWLDTPVVTPTADAASGDFRNQHPDAMVMAQLSRGLWGMDPSLPVWRFWYHSEADAAMLFIFVNALTGDVVTGVDEPQGPASIPRSLTLAQNHPNPSKLNMAISRWSFCGS